MKKYFSTLMLLSGLIAAIIGFPALASSDDTSFPESAVTQTGLLPVYGVDFEFDAAWVDHEGYPSSSGEHGNSGVHDTFRQAWEAVSPAGFNCIRFAIDTQHTRAAAVRVANLCSWAEANGVRLIVALPGSPEKLSAFARELAELMAGDANSLQAYNRILAYEVRESGIAPPASGKADQLARLASALRSAEQEALGASELAPSPILASVSFDRELLRARSMAGSVLTDEVYQQALRSLRQAVTPLVASADVDIVDIQWYPGTIGSGTVDKLPSVLEDLWSDLAGKQIVLTTGASTAFTTPWTQSQFCLAAFTNLAEFRAKNATSVPFLGMMLRRGLSPTDPDPEPPTTDLPTQIADWDLGAKSAQLAAALDGKSPSLDVDWWLKMSERRMALLAASTAPEGGSTFEPQPGLQALKQVASAVQEADASFNMDDAQYEQPQGEGEPTSQPEGYTLEGESIAEAAKVKVKEGLMGLLDRVFQVVGDKIAGAIGSESDGGWPSGGMDMSDPGYYPAESTSDAQYTWSAVSLAPEDISFIPASPSVGQQVTTKAVVRNDSPDAQAADLLVVALDSNGMLLDSAAQQSGVIIGPGGSQTVDLIWTAAQAGSLPVRVEVTDPALSLLAAADVSVSVAGSPGEGSPPASIECPESGLSVVPANPNMGAPVKIRVTVRNTGSSAAPGLDLLLVDMEADPAASLIAEADNNSVPPGGEKKVDISWIPADARVYRLGVQVWRGFEEMLTETSLSPISVASSPGGSQPISVSVEQVKFAPAAPKVGQDVTVSVDVKNEGSGVLNDVELFLICPADSAAALAYETVAVVTAGSMKKVNLGWTPETEGSREVEIQAWDSSGLLASATANVSVSPGTSGGSPVPKLPVGILQDIKMVIPPGLPRIENLKFGELTPMSGAVTQPSLNLVNPYSVPIKSLSLTFTADGRKIETRSLGTLLPGQTREIKFGDTPQMLEGKRTLEVMITGIPASLKGETKPLQGSIKKEINVTSRAIASAGALVSGGVPGMRTLSGPSPSKTPVRKISKTPVRSTLPPSFSIGGTKVASRLTPSGPVTQPTPVATGALKPIPTTGSTRPIVTGTPPGGTPPTIPGVKTTPREIPGVVRPTTTTPSKEPPPTIPGVSQPTVVKSPDRPGTITPSVTPPTGEVRPPVTSTPTVKTSAETVIKTPTSTGTSPVLRPTTSTTETTAAKTPDAVVKPGATTTSPISTVQARIAVKPNLSVVSADIKYTPRPPKPGEPLNFDITVKNKANAAASGVVVSCVLKADATIAARRAFTVQVAASGAAPVKWTLPAPKGKQLAVEITVTHADDPDTSDNKAVLAIPVVSR